jgi:hypothetical protein
MMKLKNKIISLTVLITLLVSMIVIPVYGLTPLFVSHIAGVDNDLYGARAVYISGNYAYVAVLDTHLLTIVDITDPLSPSTVGTVSSVTYLNGACSVFVLGDYAYVTAYFNDSLTIVDVTNKAAPSIVGHILGAANYLDGACDVAVSGDYAYVTAKIDDSLTIVDVTNKAAPSIVGHISGAGSPYYLDGACGVAVSGDYAYVTASDSDTLSKIDVTNKAAPSIVGRDLGLYFDGACDVVVSGGYAYVTAYNSDTLTIVDIGTSLWVGHISGVLNYLDGATGVFVSGNYAYVASYLGSSLSIFDVTTPTAPKLYGYITGSGSPSYLKGASSVFVSGSYAYVIAYNDDSLSIFEIVFHAPSIIATDASAISTTTAQLNAHIVDDGNDTGNCQVSWGYGTTSQAAVDFASYDTVTAFAGTYSEGENPFYSASSLVLSTTYYYRVQIKNSFSTVTSDEITFDTLSVVDDVIIFNGIPNKTSISLHFIMPDGASKVMIRSDTDDYPATTADGTQVFFDSGTTTSHEPLPAGTTYYYSIWGEDGGTYSVNALNLVMTTLAAEMTPTGGDSLPTPTLPPHQDPDVGVGSPFSNIEPIYSLVKNAATSLGMPMDTLTAAGALLIIAAIAMVILIGAHSVSGALLVSAVLMSLCIPMKILPWEFVGLSIPMALGAWATSKGEGSNI